MHQPIDGPSGGLLATDPVPSASLGLVIDDLFLEHDTGPDHVESRARLEAIQEFLRSYEHRDRLQSIPLRPATPEEILLVHTPRLLKQIEATAHHPFVVIDTDTVASIRSYEIARLAVGSVLQSIDYLFEPRGTRAFSFLRPPGHHAEPDRAMGFCLFNNVAIAAAYAQRRYGLTRILIVDFDVHHGNGTQAAFYDTPQVLYVSMHQHPLWPGTGSPRECGVGKGLGYTLNFPLPPHGGDDVYRRVFHEILEPVAEQYRPELVLVSAGFDPYFDDPLANMRVTPAGFQLMALSLLGIADRHCEGKILFVLEGGYNLKGLQDSARAVLDAMLGAEPSHPLSLHPAETAPEVIGAAKRYVSSFWKL